MPPKRNSTEIGSAPLELVLVVLIMLAPLPFVMNLQAQLSNQLLVDLVARHSLRAAVLHGDSRTSYSLIVEKVALEISKSWNSTASPRVTIVCSAACGKGDLLSVSVNVGRAIGNQTMALDR